MRDHYILAETAFHHEGDIDYMMRLIAEVSASSAAGIKFQILTRPLDFISSKHKDYAQLAKYCFSLNQWRIILQRAVDLDLDLVVMPLNIEALVLCEEFPVKWIEIHSVSQNDWRLKQKVKQSAYKLIITTGGRFVQEVEEDIAYFEGNVEIIMVGFQAFPSKISDIRLGQIKYWKRRYSSLHVGYADHSLYSSDEAIVSLEFAFLLGARIFEKHVSLRPGEERVDYSAAVAGEDITNIHNKLTFLEEKIIPERMNPEDFTNEEMIYRKRQLVCVATRDLEIGVVVEDGHVALKMHHQTSNSFNKIQEILGKKLKNHVGKDCLFEPHFFD